MSLDDELFDQVGLMLKSRPGWRYEPSTTPGAQPSWCLNGDGEPLSHDEFLLSVTVIDGVHSVYLPHEDREITFHSKEQLIAWIDEHEHRSGGSV
jgi:hypothetical protein